MTKRSVSSRHGGNNQWYCRRRIYFVLTFFVLAAIIGGLYYLARPRPFNPDRELRRRIAKTPVVIFSKSYCPHSQVAKDVLVQKHTIKPPPMVYELDLDPHGKEIQEALVRMTGRRTVPNCFFCGTSHGGGSEIATLDNQGKLQEVVFAHCPKQSSLKIDGQAR